MPETVRRVGPVAAALILVVSWASRATAAGSARAECAPGAILELRARALDETDRALVASHVEASFAARELDVCVREHRGPTAVLATLDVVAADDGAHLLVVEDDVTKKRVERRVDLRGVPADVRALTIALALDELLRASWAEFLLRRDRESPPLPAPVAAALASTSLPPTSPPPPPGPGVHPDVTVAFAAEHFAAGHSQLGADLEIGAGFARRLRASAGVGLRWALPVVTTRGDIDATASVATAGLGIDVVGDRRGHGVDVHLEAMLSRVVFVATPTAGTAVRGRERTGLAAYGLLGARAWYSVSPRWRVVVHAGAGAPFHTAYAFDGDARATGLGGLVFRTGIGLAWSF